MASFVEKVRVQFISNPRNILLGNLGLVSFCLLNPAAAMLIDDDVVPYCCVMVAVSNETMMYDTANCSMRQKS